MYYPSEKEFLKLAKKGNLIPVYKQISADLDTPVSAFLKIGDNAESFLLESVEGQEMVARYSFLGFQPSSIFQFKAGRIKITDKKSGVLPVGIFTTDPLDKIKQMMQKYKFVPVEGLPRFSGGLVGYIGYDTVRLFESLPDKNPDELRIPDAILMLTDTLLVFDHFRHTIKIVSNVYIDQGSSITRAYRLAIKKIEAINKKLKKPLKVKDRLRQKYAGKIKITSNFNKNEFQKIVKKAKEYIRQGEVIQVVLSQRFCVRINKIEPFDIYRNLRSLNPSPYMFFLKFKDVILIGSSPEMLVRCEDGIIRTRPIAGTRPRGITEKMDQLLERQLVNDEKEKAEHLMLVDLGRNDLGRVSRTGTVKVSDFMSVERYSHVMHLVSEVRGVLDQHKDVYDVLRAAFPAGTVSGSPKIRAMQIIDELENLRRGPYAGCVGYFSFSGNLDSCITIRTIVIKDEFAYIQAGAGIVADSRPELEYQEVINKAKAQIAAINAVKT